MTTTTRGHTIHHPRFYDILVRVLTGGHEGAFRALTLDLADLRPGERVLDVGCGTGTLAIEARGRVGSDGTVTGIDAAEEMILRAREKADAADVDVAFETAPAEALPFADGSFDVVLTSLFLHHLPDDLQPQAFREMRRVLVPGGRLLVVDFRPPRGRVGRALTSLILSHRMADCDIRNAVPLAEAAGFVDLETGATRSRWLEFLRGRVGPPRA